MKKAGLHQCATQTALAAVGSVLFRLTEIS